MKLLTAAVSLLMITGCTSFEKQVSHQNAQIDMIRIQREAQLQERVAEAEAKKALYQALQAVAVANPDHAPAVTVALAVQGLGGGEDDESTPVVQLQRQQNEALEYVKVLATPVLSTITALGVAQISADVQKNASDNAAKVQINDAQSDVAIVQSVAGLGTAAANSVGTQVGGDYYSVQDQGVIDQSVTETTTTATETTVSLNTTLNYDGSAMTLAELIEQLQEAGASYSIEVDGVAVADGEGDGATLLIDCTQPQFSPNLDC